MKKWLLVMNFFEEPGATFSGPEASVTPKLKKISILGFSVRNKDTGLIIILAGENSKPCYFGTFLLSKYPILKYGQYRTYLNLLIFRSNNPGTT